jgi:hypothetical protein
LSKLKFQGQGLERLRDEVKKGEPTNVDIFIIAGLWHHRAKISD